MLKNKKIFLIVIVLELLILPSFCFGAVNYERTPSGYTIENPINFDVSADEIEELFPFTISAFWSLGATCDFCEPEEEIYLGEYFCYPTTTLSINENVDLPLGEYQAIYTLTYSDENCEMPVDAGLYLEGTGGYEIFEVVSAEISEGIIPLNAIASTTAYISNLFNSIGPFIWLLIGIPLAFVVIDKVGNFIVPRKKETKLKTETERQRKETRNFNKRIEKENSKELKNAEKEMRKEEKRLWKQ